MRRLVFGVVAAVAATLASSEGGLALTAEPRADEQAPAGIAKTWTLPRTPDGKPDLQGTWTNATLTPLDRPGENTPLVMPKDQVAKREQEFRERVDRLAQDSDPDRPAPPKGGDGSTGAAGNVGGYNNFWIDPGDRVAMINGDYRTSLITYPDNGKVPPQTPEARQRAGTPQSSRSPRAGPESTPARSMAAG